MKIIKIAFILTIVVVLVHIVHALTFDRIIQYREVSFYSSRWPENLDGYRIAFVVDTHDISDGALEDVVRRINSLSVDMLLLGGDYSRTSYRQAIAILSRTETSDGIFGVEGNHDVRSELSAAKEDYGIGFLFNSGLGVHEGFYLAGVEDFWWRNACIDTSIAGANDDDFVLLLSHNPDITMAQDTSGVDMVVSGHSHGGQITFFGLWAPYLTLTDSFTEHGQRFMSGWSEAQDGTPVFVSNGTGGHRLIPRVFARPQVIIFTMRHPSALPE